MNELQKREILKLSVSIRNWILLRRYLEESNRLMKPCIFLPLQSVKKVSWKKAFLRTA